MGAWELLPECNRCVLALGRADQAMSCFGPGLLLVPVRELAFGCVEVEEGANSAMGRPGKLCGE